MRHTILRLIVLLLPLCSFSQQEGHYTQYMYNTIEVNPAYTGSRGAMSIFGSYRNQWVGIEGAPSQASVSIQSPVNEGPVGLGLSIANEQLGPSVENSASLYFSYAITTSYDYKLSFGLRATGSVLNVDYTKLTIDDTTDQEFQNNINNKFSPNVGLGVYYYSDFSYIGISVPGILKGNGNSNSESYLPDQKVHLYLLGGYVFNLDHRFDYDLKFKPSVLAKIVQGAPLQVDLSANFLINDKFTAGLSYRWSAAVSAMVGFQVSDSWFIGYSYDAETTAVRKYSSGSHELMLRFEIFQPKHCGCFR